MHIEPIRGRLSSIEREQIARLADHGLKAGQIASRMNRHPSTVNFAMHSMGLKAPIDRSGVTYVRKNGSAVRSFDATEDALIEELRTGGATYRAIAEACLARFGRKRSAATIGVRLKMLANREG